MALRSLYDPGDGPPPLPAAVAAEADLRELLVAIYQSDIELVHYIDRRKKSMPADLAAFATVLRDARLHLAREIERRFGLAPYERR
jgi:hypothetical protein